MKIFYTHRVFVPFVPSVHDYTGNMHDRPFTPSGLSVDRVFLPADPRTRT